MKKTRKLSTENTGIPILDKHISLFKYWKTSLKSTYFSLWTTQMIEVQAIQFTQDQARTITGISSETLRHWRKIIPYLAEKSGKSARFSFSDLICLASTAQAIEDFGVSISNIGPSIDTLLRKLAESRPAMLQNQAIILRGTNATICHVDEIGKLDFSNPVMVIPLAKLTESMRQCLLPELSAQQQLEIPFTLQSVRG